MIKNASMATCNIKANQHWRKLFSACILSGFLVACGSSDSEDTTVETPVETPVTPPAPTTPPVSGPDSEACLTTDNATLVTDSGVEYLVTPDACFESLTDYDFAANYVEIDGLRMHYVDEGPSDGEVVLMLHGQPSWSYLYRKMIPILADAGYRVIAPDNIGMGKSDKPVDVSIHQYEQHVAWTKAFINQLELTDINLFVQDWGSLIGLRVAGNMSQHFSRITIANGDLFIFPTGQNPYTYPSFEIDESLPDATTFFATKSDDVAGFQQWINYAAAAPDWLAGDVLQTLTTIQLSDEEVSAYNAPYPSQDHKAAIRSFPALMTGIDIRNLLAWQTLGAFSNPFMFAAGEHDEGLGSPAVQQKWIAHVPGSEGNDHRRFDAGHFIQDDVGEELGLHYLDFLQTTSPDEILVPGGSQYNFRYCEILLPFLEDGQIIAQIWGTPGVSFCPQAQWDALDFEQIAQDNGAISAIPNGPRFFLIDESLNNDTIGDGEEASVQMFGDMQMRLLTVVDLSASQGEQEAYIPGAVSRNNIWVYKTGRRIYELIDAEGNTYVMQSFSRISDAELQIDDLKNLGERLTLPDGWTYNSRIITEQLEVAAVDSIAMVIQDDLGNSYQLVP